MQQKFYHYEKWEDFKNGMYKTANIKEKENKILAAINLLSNPFEFYKVCKKILIEWPISCDVNLSNINQNRKAWIGAAGCCYNSKTPEILTREAWSKLSMAQQNQANKIAQQIIYEYERKNKPLHKNMGKQMLLQWDT